MNLKVNKIKIESNVRATKPNKSSVAYKRLKNNIAQLGMLTPVLVTKSKNDYILLDGHQRYSIAQDLGMEEITVSEVHANDTLRSVNQAAVNIMKIDMSLIDGAVAMKQVIEENPTVSYEWLSNLFGKSNEWVSIAVAISNAIPEVFNMLKKEYKVDGVYFDNCFLHTNDNKQIVSFLSKNKEQQKSTWKAYKDYTDKEQIDLDDFQWYLSRHSATSRSIRHTVDSIGVEKYRKYEKEYGFVNEYENSLFKHYSKDNFCTDEKFMEFLVSKSPIGSYLLKNYADKQVSKDKLNYVDKGRAITVYASELFKRKAIKEVKDSEVIGWALSSDCDVRINTLTKNAAKELKKDNDKEAKKEQDPFRLSYTKLHKWQRQVAEKYFENEIMPQIKKLGSSGIPIAFDWIVNHTTMVTNLRERYGDGDGHPSTVMMSYNPTTYLHNLTRYYLKENHLGFTYVKLNSLGSLLGCIDYTKYVENYYISMSKSEKVEFLSQFNVKTLNIFAQKNIRKTKEFLNKKDAIDTIKNLGKDDFGVFPYSQYLYSTFGQTLLQNIIRY